MDLGLKGKVALVAGGSEGIGAAAAKILSAEGAKVAICGRSLDSLQATKEMIKQETGVDIYSISADFSKPVDINRFIEEAAGHFGGIDILVNSVGSSQFGSFDQVPDEAWVRDVSLKLFGAVRACRAVLPHLQKRGSGRVINVAGNSGKQPYNWHFPGGAANAALINFTHAFSQEVVKHNILVTVVCPGPVETRRLRKQLNSLSQIWEKPLDESEVSFYESLPLKRAATADEVGYLIAFLASDKAAYITGTAITIDGGITKGI